MSTTTQPWAELGLSDNDALAAGLVLKADREHALEVRSILAERYQDEIQAVELLMSLPELMDVNRKLAEHRDAPREQRDEWRMASTETAFLATNFAISNSHRPEAVRAFWEMADNLVPGEDKQMLHRFRKSTMAVAASAMALEAAGREAKLATPSDDADRSVDLWSGEISIQVTQCRKGGLAIVTPEDYKNLKACRTLDDSAISPFALERIRSYRRSIMGRGDACLMVVPGAAYDSWTGAPNARFIRQFKENPDAIPQPKPKPVEIHPLVRAGQIFAEVNDYALREFRDNLIERGWDAQSATAVLAMPELAALYEEVGSDESQIWDGEQLKLEMTEITYVVTDLLTHRNDRFVRSFWKQARKVVEAADQDSRSLIAFQKGVLGVTATVAALRSGGFKPELATPKEDAYKAVDLWLTPEVAVQVKRLNIPQKKPVVIKPGEPVYLKADNPVIRERVDGIIDKFSRRQDQFPGRDSVERLLVLVPRNAHDRHTGRPVSEFSRSLHEQLRSLGLQKGLAASAENLYA